MNEPFSAEAWFAERWREMQNDASPVATALARAEIVMLERAGIINHEQRQAWSAAIEKCPGDHEESRVWCAYCGNLKRGG